MKEYTYKIRLGLEVKNKMICVRDLYDFVKWEPNCPSKQKIDAKNGFYHITLLTNLPKTGVYGDDQEILVYLNLLNNKPSLKYLGVPMLCS